MNIASITFFNPVTQIGGGSVPAQAFVDWCKIFGHNATLISEPADLQKICKNHDAIFFNTPPRSQIDLSGISIPFALMIHDETDESKYPQLKEMAEHKLCKVLVHIDHDGDYYNRYHANRIAWHPCCRPKYLCHPPANKINSSRCILYAARIVPWKNAHLLKAFSEYEVEPCIIQGRVDDLAYAKCTGVKAAPFRQPAYSFADLFWDVCGTETNQMAVRRMNLAAFEAIAHGLMPIVNPKAIPEELQGMFIEANPLKFNLRKLKIDIEEYRRNRHSMWKHMTLKLDNSYAAFDKVKYAVGCVINSLNNGANA